MLNKKTVEPGSGRSPTSGWLFTALLVAVIIIVGALTFFPALSLGSGGGALPGAAPRGDVTWRSPQVRV